MSEEIAASLRAGLEEFNRTGVLGQGLLASDVELIQASSIVDTAGTFAGPDGLQAALAELREAFDDLAFEPTDIVEAPPDRLVAFIRVRGRGRGSGLSLDNQIAWLLKLHEGKITRIVVYEEPADALAAAELSE